MEPTIRVVSSSSSTSSPPPRPRQAPPILPSPSPGLASSSSAASRLVVAPFEDPLALVPPSQASPGLTTLTLTPTPASTSTPNEPKQNREKRRCRWRRSWPWSWSGLRRVFGRRIRVAPSSPTDIELQVLNGPAAARGPGGGGGHRFRHYNNTRRGRSPPHHPFADVVDGGPGGILVTREFSVTHERAPTPFPGRERERGANAQGQCRSHGPGHVSPQVSPWMDSFDPEDVDDMLIPTTITVVTAGIEDK